MGPVQVLDATKLSYEKGGSADSERAADTWRLPRACTAGTRRHVCRYALGCVDIKQTRKGSKEDFLDSDLSSSEIDEAVG